MKKLILAVAVVAPLVLVTGCVTETVYYTPTYTGTSVYSAKHYNGPYWNDAYYYGYDDLGDVGYWGMYNSYSVY